MSSQNPHESLEHIASEIISVELTDLPALVGLGERFTEIAGSLKADFPECAAACHACASLIEAIVLENTENPEAALKGIEETVSMLQDIINEQQESRDISFPVYQYAPNSAPSSDDDANAASSDTSEGSEAEDNTEAASEGAQLEASKEGQTEDTENQGDDGEEDSNSILEPVAITDGELVGEFIEEAQEHFDIADESLLTLENNPADADAISAVFRAFHTLKGTSGFLELPAISELAHKAENVLDAVRNGRLSFQGEVADAAFAALDSLKTLVSEVSEALSSGEKFRPSQEVVPVVDRLLRLLEGETSTTAADEGRELSAQGMPSAAGAEGEHSGEAMSGDGDTAENQAESQSVTDVDGNQSQQQNAGAKEVARQTMKIDAGKIDNLLDTIGELVIVESIVTQDDSIKNIESASLQRNLSQLTKITRALQDMGMSMRMVPIGATFRKMSRLVRDLSRKAGKDIQLSVSGEDTEIDKGMVEKLNDPLIHMVRNAVDHGIEDSPEEREAAGKPKQGNVYLKAYHEGGSIHLQISDDGGGLDREGIAERAKERGVITDASNMSDEEVYSLIFEPGFSTAKQITNVSGRGVGMDVVKSNIEQMRGNVRIESEKGKGSTFTLVLPLTMAIIDGMHCKVGSEQYIIPLLSIIQSFQPAEGSISTVQGRGEMVPFRGNLVPLFRLGELFHTEDAKQEPTEAIAVVVEDAGRRAALLVDELLGQNQTVIKSLGDGLGEVSGLAGATILSDGSPGLIIDIHGVVEMATGRVEDEKQKQ